MSTIHKEKVIWKAINRELNLLGLNLYEEYSNGVHFILSDKNNEILNIQGETKDFPRLENTLIATFRNYMKDNWDNVKENYASRKTK